MIPQHIKAVIFDVDGLLIDSEPFWHRTTETFFEMYNRPFHPQVHSDIMGTGLWEMMEYFKREHGFVGDTEKLVVQRRELLYSVMLQEVTLMEGAEKLIRDLHRKKVSLAIATSGHAREKTKEILGKFDLENFFPLLVSGDDVVRAKPAPDIYLLTAKLLGVDPKECLVLEDSSNGVLAGKAAGMYVIGVNKEEKLYNKLKEAGADNVLHSLFEIHA